MSTTRADWKEKRQMRRTFPLLVGAALFVLTAGVAMAQNPSTGTGPTGGAPTGSSQAGPESGAAAGAAGSPTGQTQPMKHTHKMMRHHRMMHHRHHHKASSSMAPASEPTP